MIKQFFKDAFVYSFSGVLSRGIGIILVPIYTRMLSPKDYGVMDMITVFGVLVNLSIALEIAQGFGRFYPETESERERIEYSSTALWFTLLAYFTFGLIMFFYSEPMANLLLGSNNLELIFQVGALSIVGNGIFGFLQNQLRYSFRSNPYMLASIVMVVLSAASSIFFIAYLKTGVIGIFYGQIVGLAAGCSVSFGVGIKSYAFLFKWEKCKGMLAFSLPLVPSSISVFVANYVDRIAIKKLMTMADVGLYGVGFRFASIIFLLSSGIQIALVPLIYKNYKNPSMPEELSKIARYYVIGGIMLMLFLSIFSKELMVLLTTPNFYSAKSVIPILSLSVFFSGMTVFVPGLDILKKTKMIAIINISSAIINTALNFTLIPILGIVGSALATLISSISMFFAYLFFSKKFYPINYRLPKLLKGFIFGFAVVLIELFLNSTIDVPLALSLIIKSLLLLISLPILSIIVLGKDEFLEILKKMLSFFKIG